MKYAGVRLLSILSCACVLVGTLLFVLSKSFTSKMIGRALFGLGEGPLEVVMELIAMRWFEPEGPRSSVPSLELAFGVNSGFGLAGSLFALNVIPLLIVIVGTTSAYMFMSLIPTLSVCVAIFYAVIDFWATPEIGLADEEDEDTNLQEVCRTLSVPYWILFFMGGSLWALLYIVLVFLTDYMTEKWAYTNIQSGQFTSLAFGAGIFSSLSTGWFMGKFGNALALLFGGCVLFTVMCFLASCTMMHPGIASVAFGVCLGIFEPTLYTCLAAVLPEKGLSTAFMFTALFFQISLFGLPFFFGYIHDLTNSYDMVFQISGGIGVLNILLVVYLWGFEPNLQNVVDVVYNRQYFRPVVVIRKKHHRRPRRHSITLGELDNLVEKLDRKNAQDVINLEPLSSNLSAENPALLSLIYDNEEKLGLHGSIARPSSLPTNFFSKLTEKVIKIEPVAVPLDVEGLITMEDHDDQADDSVLLEYWRSSTH
eukprot:TRINITY_DN14020_c0_g2_i8.p1 TRINITY_DN14020_c0_g2~~TRINITY_DN14020_c0_g2_i8.p1  ORF type:complete len:481 (+),score=71.57 TRINITY_DN14020_c0_g2_i8:458-1900(+)